MAGDSEIQDAIAEAQARRAVLGRIEEALNSLEPGDFPTLCEVLGISHQALNGSGNTNGAKISVALHPVNGSGRKDRSAKGSLEAAVRKATRSLKRNITAPGVVEYLTNKGFAFTAKKPVAAVGAVLRRMAEDEDGVLEELQPAAGRRAAIYTTQAGTQRAA